MTKDEFKNRLAAGLYNMYEADNDNVLGVYADSIEIVTEGDYPVPEIWIYYSRETYIGGRNRTGYKLSDLEELMELVCDD